VQVLAKVVDEIIVDDWLFNNMHLRKCLRAAATTPGPTTAAPRGRASREAPHRCPPQVNPRYR